MSKLPTPKPEGMRRPPPPKRGHERPAFDSFYEPTPAKPSQAKAFFYELTLLLLGVALGVVLANA